MGVILSKMQNKKYKTKKMLNPLIVCFIIFFQFKTLYAFKEEDKTLFEKKCQGCHPLRLPLSKNKSPEDWYKTVSGMVEKMKFLAQDEMKKIISYLSEVRGIKDDEFVDEAVIIEDATEQGKKFFNDVRLGNSGKSCSSCHNENQNPLKKKAFLYPKYFQKVGKIINLEQRINYCIIKYMEGEALKLGSDEIITITVYLYSLI